MLSHSAEQDIVKDPAALQRVNPANADQNSHPNQTHIIQMDGSCVWY